MQAIDIIKNCIDGNILSIADGHESEICEIRLRINRPARIRMIDGSCAESVCVSETMLEKAVTALSMGSYYAIEEQLRQGYFTMQGGVRVGVCGKMNRTSEGDFALSAIGSVCIRIPREVKGCAAPLWEKIGFCNLLILSPPGMGKTTLIRDYARIASNGGYDVAIADERREIAACLHGIPQMDVGKCTDVIDDCPKERAIPLLLRACKPQMIVADEIAPDSEAMALREASKCGVKIAATAHAGSMEDARNRRAIGDLLQNGIFSAVCVLGEKPGKIIDIYQ